MPAIGHDQTASVSCRITDQTYQTFYANLNGSATVYKQVSYANPPYPGTHT